jgi:Ca2+-transporting ATPase
VVFEAEPIEPDAMRAPPRRTDVHLFDAEVMRRGLLQGAGLLAVLVAVQVLARQFTGADDVARATTFTVLVLSNLCLIHANRTWRVGAWRAAGPTNQFFWWITGGTLLLLGAALGIPAIRQLFAFGPLSPGLLLGAAGAALASRLWFEAVKWGLSRNPVRAL